MNAVAKLFSRREVEEAKKARQGLRERQEELKKRQQELRAKEQAPSAASPTPQKSTSGKEGKGKLKSVPNCLLISRKKGRGSIVVFESSKSKKWVLSLAIGWVELLPILLPAMRVMHQ